jgi:hypothetical protein
MENIKFCSITAAFFRLRARILNVRVCHGSVLAFARLSGAKHSGILLDASSRAKTTVGANYEIFDSSKKNAQRLNNFLHFQPKQ